MQIVALAMGLIAEGNEPSLLPHPIILMMIMLAFYFIVMRPARDERRRQTVLDGLKKNDRVVTTFGVKAQVSSVNREKNEVVLTLDKSSKAQMTVTLPSISHLVVDENKKTEEKSAE